MNDNEKFLQELAPFYKPLIYKGKLPADLLSKPIFGNSYEILDLSHILLESEQNAINPFKAISYWIRKGNSEHIDYQKGLTLCSHMMDLPPEQKHFASIDEIESICLITGSHASYVQRVKLYVKQLKLIGLVDDDNFKKQLSLQKYKQILDIKNSSENQLIIFNHWKKSGFNVEEIKSLVPSMVSESPSVETIKKEFYIVKMDCNKIAKDKNIKKSAMLFLAVEFILNQLSKFEENVYEYKKSQDQSNHIEFLTSKNPENLNSIINTFLDELISTKMISKILFVSGNFIINGSNKGLLDIINEEKFKSMIFNFNLDNKLEPKLNHQNKKSKI